MIAEDDPSPHPRPPPACPHSGCPGCALAHLPAPEQMETKRRTVAEALALHLGRIVPVDAVVPAPRTAGYRAGAKLVFGRQGTRVVLGIFARGSHRVVDIPRCPAHTAGVAAAARALRTLIGRAPGLVWQGPGGQGWLRYAAFQESRATGRVAVTLVTRTDEGAGTLRSLAARLREAVPAVAGVAWNVNPSSGNAVFGPRWEPILGDPVLEERFLGLEFRASPGAFLQANRDLADEAYRALVEALDPGPGDDVLDLYSGVGVTAIALAARARRVVGVEAHPVAADDARANARRAGVENALFRQGDAAAEAWELVSEGFRPAVAVLNPARKGADAGVIDALAALEPRRIAYLSCNPQTLARDLALLLEQAPYRIVRVTPYDFLPGTDHVETLVLLERGP
ncbi:23S rRNA (uracil(1939)-C(5))-methyltransferase RlmD [Deferrisoma camini]|uniref:23S rRNA (uracil(1939)-C(5))-methyltransferase RlmD n=1 Tax=Deferrisoma camini TaxID=1035120 RepID=UPI000A04E55E|nr:23S rRNA (uracil(1939)-C(5))-methyltransferase RlmD [Deferrisoma camini]